jgi:U3 small nucleolar RNA-associated protein 20
MDRIYERKKRAVRVYVPGKNATKAWKNHTFEPFSQRVEKTRIDPIRRPRGYQQEEPDLSETASYFRVALEKWNESNQSENYTAFSRTVDNISDSLPQILHHEDQIISLLVQSIKSGSVVSLEPLLDLVAQLAHDLGVRFMKHLSVVVDCLIDVASANPDIEAVEWCFNCLTWLFKYLSRLLVPDLCPLYDQLAPLLGKKHKQKHFVYRFTAEAFSFLIRKTGSEKDQAALELITKHILNDVCLSRDEKYGDEYSDSVASVFAEAILGVKGTVSSNGKAVLNQVINVGLELNNDTPSPLLPALDVAQDVIVGVLNKADKTAIAQILDVVLEKLERPKPAESHQQLSALLSILMHCIVLNKGSGVPDWKRLFAAVKAAQVAIDETPALSPAILHVVAALAVVHKTSPLDAAVQHVKLLETVSENYFVRFAALYAELSWERFRTFLLPVLQRYLIAFAPSVANLSGFSLQIGSGTAKNFVLCSKGSQ